MALRIHTCSGTIEKLLGSASDLTARTQGILESNDIEDTDFSPEVLRCLPGGEYAISEEEVARRRDLRKSCIFTIDPSTARDLVRIFCLP